MLTQYEISMYLRAVTNITMSELEQLMSSDVWSIWDRDNSGGIDIYEFIDEKRGFVKFMYSKYPSVYTGEHAKAVSESDVVPDIVSSPMEWFQYYDEDGSKTLSKDELFRAVVHLFQPFYDFTDVSHLLDGKRSVTSLFSL